MSSILQECKTAPWYDAPTQAVIARFTGGEESAVDAFVERFTPLVESTVRRILAPLGDAADAEQAVVDVFYKLWLARARLPQNEEILYFILAAARRTAIDVYRKTKRLYPKNRCSFEDLPAETQSVPCQEQGYRAPELRELLDTLPAEARELFTGFYLQGATAPELAARYRLALPTVYTRLRRARLALQKTLQKGEP